MRKAIVMMLLAAVSSSAAAGWVEVGGTDNFAAYVDPATVRRTGNMVKMWHLLDLKAAKSSASGKPYLSQKVQHEYDCKDERIRLLYFSWHSGNMGSGEAVVSYANLDKWEPVPPESVNELLWKVACGKR